MSVRQQLERKDQIVRLLGEHVDEMFEFTGKDRAPEFVQVIKAKIGRLGVSESPMKQGTLRLMQSPLRLHESDKQRCLHILLHMDLEIQRLHQRLI